MADEPIEVVVAFGDEDALAGRLYSHRRRGRESASFTYDPTYLARPEAYALDPALPLTQGAQQTAVGLEMFRGFADAAPDRWGRTLIARAEQRRADIEGTTPRSLGEIDFLLGVRDRLRQGALRFRRPGGPYLADDADGVPALTDLPTLLELAERADRDDATYAELRRLLVGAGSPGGARPKAHVIDEDGVLAIAKFPSARNDTWNVMAWEKVALDLARDAGVVVPDSRLLRIAGRSVLVERRFDREGDRRIGYVSAMTMLEASDGDVGSYVDIAGVIETVSPAAAADLRQLWRRIAFGVLISNTDDHLRNHGFVHERGPAWSLSPAFDLNPDPAPGPKELSTAIDGYDTAASIPRLMSVAGLFRLTDANAATTLGEVVAAVRRWTEVARRHDLTESEIAAMRPAFEHDQAVAAQSLVAAP